MHIGLQKTGTTFLQENVFKKLGVNYIHYLESIRYKCFDLSKPLLISNENLCGLCHHYYDKSRFNGRYDNIRNLKYLFPNAKIIFGVRNKDDWIKSLYKESVRQGLFICYTRFKDSFSLDILDFDYYIDFLGSMFGEGNVFVYRYEDLKKDNYGVIKQICDFIGVDIPADIKYELVNKSITDIQLLGFRFVNFFLKSDSFNPNGWIPHMWFDYIYRFVRGEDVDEWIKR